MTTIESPKYLPRVKLLDKVPAKIKGISWEPLLDEISVHDLENIIASDGGETNLHWWIVGGESGNRARPMQAQWVRNIRAVAQYHGIAFLLKQWGTWLPRGQYDTTLTLARDWQRDSKDKNGNYLDGVQYLEWPEGIKLNV